MKNIVELSQAEKDELRQIYEIFNNHYQQHAPRCNGKWQWFKSILNDLEVFGHNYVYRLSGRVIDSTKATERNKDTVSINSFSILTVNNTFPKAMERIYSDEATWSHPAVLRILRYCSTGVLKQGLHAKDVTDNELWPDIKLFINMIFGAINSAGGVLFVGRPSGSLKIGDSDIGEIYKEAVSIVKDAAAALGCLDQLVVADIDEAILAVNKEALAGILKHVDTSQISLSDDVTRLNRICRKFKIDIVK